MKTRKTGKRIFLQIEITQHQRKLFRAVATARGLRVATWARTMLIQRASTDMAKF